MEEVRIKVPPGKIYIKNGSCPNGCRLANPAKLMSGKPALTTLIRVHGQTGHIHLNPFFGLFEYESDLELKDGDIVGLYCPHCNVSLASTEPCPICRVPMFTIHLPDGGEVRACPKVGCKNHILTIVDLDAQFADYYNEETRPKM